MSTERYVVLGLAHVRAAWFVDVARWATSGTLPVEFVKCVSAEELRSRVASGRPFSAALLDGRLPAVDRDLLATLQTAGIAPLVVDDGSRDWATLGAPATLGAEVGRSELLAALEDNARPVAHLADGGAVPTAADHPVMPAAWRGRLVAVLGGSGAGASTLAAALAQDLADDPRYAADVILADLARQAHQALLHDAGDIVPGLQELVEAHRSERLGPDQVRELTFEVADRGYRLLLGLRRPRDWVSIRSRAFTTALDSLCRSARVVVADVDPELEGEADTGSIDVEERHLLARVTTAAADLVIVAGLPTTTGIHGLVGSVRALRSHGVDADRILAVVNRAPRRARLRSEVAAAVAELVGLDQGELPHLGPAFVGHIRQVDRLHHDVVRFPGPLAHPVGRAVRAALDRLEPRGAATDFGEAEPVAVVPGSLGTWAAGAADGEAPAR